MKAIAVALTLIFLTAQVGNAAPKAPIDVPEWAAALMSRVPFLTYFAAFEDSRQQEREQTAQQSLAPEAKYRQALQELVIGLDIPAEMSDEEEPEAVPDHPPEPGN